MPGRVVSVDVKVGDTVAKGQGVVVLEAMKMQNELVSPADGKVKAVHCKPGDNVDPGKVLVEID
jgi:pyruvate carboxylase subunit B